MKKIKDFILEYKTILLALFSFLSWLNVKLALVDKNAERIEYVYKKQKEELQRAQKEEIARNKEQEKKNDIIFAMINKMSDEMNYKIGHNDGKLDGYIAGKK